MKTAFIVNSIAIKRCPTEWRKVEGYIKDNHCFPCDVRMTQSCGQASGLTRDAIGSGYERVVAVGGDGTMNEVINGIANSDVVMGIIPTGTANDLASYYKIPPDINDACDIIKRNTLINIMSAQQNKSRIIVPDQFRPHKIKM